MDFIIAKTIVNKVKNSGWFGIDYNMNIYKGCCHGCIYCDSRSRCYQIENFDTVRAKIDSTEIINRELKGKIKKGVVGTGAMSDPYNPYEKKYELTREALKLVDKYGYGIAIDTPNVSSSSERFDSIRRLSESGIYAGILMGPILPFIEDNEENIRGIIDLAHDSGAKFINFHPGVTLRDNQREWYYDKLDESFPNLKYKYMQTYGYKYNCLSPKYKNLLHIFKEECDKKNIIYNMEDIIEDYKNKYKTTQISLFD